MKNLVQGPLVTSEYMVAVQLKLEENAKVLLNPADIKTKATNAGITEELRPYIFHTKFNKFDSTDEVIRKKIVKALISIVWKESGQFKFYNGTVKCVDFEKKETCLDPIR
tara:strand:+ start:822 stop:1151 length:330 start_codon:yes stop_codon:yes gene_type:complete